jgi:hypothetical protein
MAKATPNPEDQELLRQISKENGPETVLRVTGALTMRDLVIASALQMGMERILKTYMLQGRMGDRRPMIERAAVEVINFADIMSNAFDVYEANKESNA